MVKVKSYFDLTEDVGVSFDGREFDKDSPELVAYLKANRLTNQSDKEACDINRLLARFEKTGTLPQLIKENPQYGDFSSMPEFLEANVLIKTAQAQFGALDAKVRARFGNDAAQFLDFMSDIRNVDEMVKLGLATRNIVDLGKGEKKETITVGNKTTETVIPADKK